MNRCFAVTLCFLFALGEPEHGIALAQSPTQVQDSRRKASADEGVTDRIREATATLGDDETRRKEAETKLKKAESEFQKASEHYELVKERLSQLTNAASTDAEAVTAQRNELEAAKQRFDLAIQRRQMLQQQLSIVRDRIDIQERLLEQLTRLDAPPLTHASPANEAHSKEAAPHGMRPNAEPRNQAAKQTDDSTAESSSPDSAADADAAADSPGISLIPGVPRSPLAPPANEIADDTVDGKAQPVEFTEFVVADPELLELRRVVNLKRARLESIRNELTLRDTELETLSSDLAATESLIETERRSMETLDRTLQRARQAEARDAAADAETTQTSGAIEPVETLEQRLEESQQSLADAIERAQVIRNQIRKVQATREEVVRRANELSTDLRGLSARLWFLESPVAPRNLYRWIITRGPIVLGILLFAILAVMLTQFIARRIVMGLVRHGRRGSLAEREERAETLRRVFTSATHTIIVIFAALAFLQQMGVDVTVLVGGAAVVGMAIAFGAQNLIKDYFTGFMILVENQYSVGNVIRIGNTSGLVENITMRMTVLRDLEGTVHFIPHGTVTQVSNLTYGWSRVVLDIGIAYKENVDNVINLLHDILVELRDDEKFGPLILGEPEILGVDQFSDSAVVIKLLIKTRPLKQWEVKREMLRRTKLRFDKLGIEIPFPHRTLVFENASP